jgi:hypothetical protein
VAQSPENPAPPLNHRYEVVNKGTSWARAKSEAEKRGGYLAVINDAQEQETIANMLNKKNNYWLGAIREGRGYKWVNGEPMNYTNWSPGDPHYGSEDRILLVFNNRSNVWLWFDVNQSRDNNNCYIIEWD